MKDKSFPEILRIISEQLPPRPSETEMQVREQMPHAGLLASGLHSRTGVRRTLRGDLDNICLKALAKERSERYQTVEGLATDIRRHLASLPIHARPPSSWYRINKYVNRHRVGVASASVILILVLGWLSSALWQRNAARAQAQQNLRRAYAADMNLGMQAYETANLTRLNDILARYKTTLFTKNWEYRLLQNLARPKAQLLVIPHSSDVWDVTFSPNSKTLATACADGFARIYSVPEGKILATTGNKEANIWRLKFSPDGKSLATASGDADSTSVKIWSVATGAEILSLVGHTARVRAVDFSPDGKLIATGSRDGTIRIWNAVGRELKKLIVGTPTETEDLHFTPDGLKLVAASRTSSRIWEVSSGRVLFKFEPRTWITCAVSSDGKWFVFGGLDGKIQVFGSNPIKLVNEIAAHEAKINNLTFSPDGSIIASASSDRTVRLFDARSGEELQNLKAHLSDAWSVTFSPDGKFIATSGTDFNMFLFDKIELLKSSSFAFPVSAGRSWSTISPDRSKAAVVDPAARHQTLWNVIAKSEIAEFSTEPISAGSFSPDNTVLATVNETGVVAIWNSTTGSEIRRFSTHRPTGEGFTFAPDGKHLVSADADKTVRIWNANNGAMVREVCRLNDALTALGVSPDGRIIFVGSLDRSFNLFDFETGKLIAHIDQQPKAITAVAFEPGGQTFATGAAAGEIQIRQTADAKLVASLTGSAGRITALTYSPDGTRLVSASGDGVMRFWDTMSFDLVLTVHSGAPYMNFIAFTPDGNTLISHGMVGRIRLWEATPR